MKTILVTGSAGFIVTGGQIPCHRPEDVVRDLSYLKNVVFDSTFLMVRHLR